MGSSQWLWGGMIFSKPINLWVVSTTLHNYNLLTVREIGYLAAQMLHSSICVIAVKLWRWFSWPWLVLYILWDSFVPPLVVRCRVWHHQSQRGLMQAAGGIASGNASPSPDCPQPVFACLLNRKAASACSHGPQAKDGMTNSFVLQVPIFTTLFRYWQLESTSPWLTCRSHLHRG